MEVWAVLALSMIYIGSLFGVAWYGDRLAERTAARTRRYAPVYAMTMMVYLTAWSFYGSVGRAARQGFDFTAIYLGPTLLLLFGRRLITKVIIIAKEQNATSIADFLSSRYGKSQWVAGLVTGSAIVALLPYIALQLKAVATAYDILVGGGAGPVPPPVPWRDTAFAVSLLMALFAILFGVRHIHASEHHRGLMLAIAFESVIKLAAFLLVAGSILFALSGGLPHILMAIDIRPDLAHLARADVVAPGFLANTVLAAAAFLCLPQMFHVAVVENDDPAHLRPVSWMLPSYMLVLTVFAVPIAAIGLIRFGHAINPDSFMMALPLAAGRTGLGLLAFIGGLSAATGMVIVTAVALSTMVCNDVVVPLVLGRSLLAPLPDRDLSKLLLAVRRISVCVILLLAYVTYRMVNANDSLVSIGLLSFVGVAQFAPSFVGGLYWLKGNRNGAIGGLAAGLAVWLYTLLIPALSSSSSPPRWQAEGPFGVGWLAPHALFGGAGLGPVAHATLWSLLINALVYAGLSLLTRASAVERAQASAFVTSAMRRPEGDRQSGARTFTIDDLTRLVSRFVGPEHAEQAFLQFLAGRPQMPSKEAVADALHFTERFLAGAIGAASARVVLAAALQSGPRSLTAAQAMLDEASVAIQFNRDLLRATLENVSQGICVLDRELRVAAWNQRYLGLLGFPERLLRVGTHLSELVQFNQERGEYRSEDLERLLLNQDLVRTEWPYVYERTRPDGTVLETCFTRMPDGGFVATYTDVTDRHRAAAELRKANESLEERVEERTLALAAAKSEAERANLDKTRFLASAGHDLLQPLNASRLFLSALTERLGRPPGAGTEDDREDAANLANNAATSLRSVEQLITRLLDISSLDSGVIRPKIGEVRVDELLTRLAVEFAPLAAARSLRLKVRKTAATVESDPQLLRRILQNFLSNALRYTAHGGVLVGCRRRGDTLRIEVFDTGPGIPDDKRDEIFLEFHRLPTATSVEKGLGLGLAIVKRVAGLLGHPIAMTSRLGKGTMFAVTVPLVAALTNLPSPQEDVPAGDPAAGLTVLCIDNEPAVLEGMRALLGGWGCRVVVATSLASARDALGAAIPDLVLADYHLDEAADGLAAVGALRDGWRRRVPAALVTADRSETVRQQAALIGCEVIYKPVKPAKMRSFIGRVARAAASEEACL